MMNKSKRIRIAILVASAASVACDEYQVAYYQDYENPQDPQEQVLIGAPSGKNIGGGGNYLEAVDQDDATLVVSSYEELKQAIADASTGDIIYVPEGVEIDATGQDSLIVDKAITIASSRGFKGGEGALIFTNSDDTFGLFRITAMDVRVTGFRILGADGEIGESAYGTPLSSAFEVLSARTEIDNCEISHFSYTAVRFDNRLTEDSFHHVHHNAIHHIRRTGLGYGVTLNNAEALIEYNYFEKNRHAVAGTGLPRTSYEARFNVVGEGYQGGGHTFDMHRMEENPGEFPNNTIAGTYIHIHHNTVLDSFDRAVYIRGRALKSVEIHHNFFTGESVDSEILLFTKENVSYYENRVLPAP